MLKQIIDIKLRLTRLEEWRNGRTSYPSQDIPEDCRVTNEERAMVEVYEWKTNIPSSYFLYVNDVKRIVTTWMGDKLGHITWMGIRWRSNMGDRRINIRVKGTNGAEYYGTYFCDSGDYARIKRVKHEG